MSESEYPKFKGLVFLKFKVSWFRNVLSVSSKRPKNQLNFCKDLRFFSLYCDWPCLFIFSECILASWICMCVEYQKGCYLWPLPLEFVSRHSFLYFQITVTMLIRMKAPKVPREFVGTHMKIDALYFILSLCLTKIIFFGTLKFTIT